MERERDSEREGKNRDRGKESERVRDKVLNSLASWLNTEKLTFYINLLVNKK